MQQIEFNVSIKKQSTWAIRMAKPSTKNVKSQTGYLSCYNESMIQEWWQSFPRLLEQKINALLDDVEPSPAKAFQLYKTCQMENLWSDSFEKFSRKLMDFYSKPRRDRRKSDLDRLLDRPINSRLFENFHLNFHNALVNSSTVMNIVSWAHNLMRVSLKTDSVVISLDVLGRTLHYITHPPLFEKSENILFEDFCNSWKKIVFQLFGKKYDAELNKIMNELQWLNTQIKEAEEAHGGPIFFPTIYLTQTEIDWVEAIQKAVLKNTPVPDFPLSRGPQKPRLLELERTSRLYRIVETTKLPELLKHRERIRITLLDQCDRLLRERAR